MAIQKLGLRQQAAPHDEVSDIAKVTEIEVRLIERATEERTSQDQHPKQPRILRGQHPKQHGCVWAEFTIESDLPPEDIPEDIKVGIFKEFNKTFPAWIRFSNARKQDDSKGGAHGMAIKLMKVEGKKVLKKEENAKTQDFVLFDHPVFFIRNVKDYVLFDEELEKALNKSPNAPNPIKFIFPGLNPFKWRLHELCILRALQSKKIGSPLETQYWSATPYKLGAKSVKYFVKPSNKKSFKLPLKTKDYLREAMIDRLTTKKDMACFDFYIQVQTDSLRMPIEDPTIDWRNAKEYKVATIKILPQNFDSPEQMAFGENLSYTPWHSLPEHEPIGGINRARREVYMQTSELRHRKNRVLSQEPTPETFAPALL